MYSLGETIRSLRKQKGLSQEELADGICSPVSISRIENGVQMPSSTVLDAILNKLDTGTYQICDIYYRNEKQISFENKAEIITKLISEGKIEEAGSEIKPLEALAENDNLNLQYYKFLYASVKLYSDKDYEEIMHILDDAIRLTKPNLVFNDFRNALLTIREVNILNAMIVVLYKMDKTVEAIHLGEELITVLNRQKSGLKEYQVLKINTAYNIAQCMEHEKRYKEALEYIELAEEYSINSYEQILLPEIEFSKAKVLHLLGDDEECMNIIKAIVPYMELIHKFDFAKIVKDYAEKIYKS